MLATRILHARHAPGHRASAFGGLGGFRHSGGSATSRSRSRSLFGFGFVSGFRGLFSGGSTFGFALFFRGSFLLRFVGHMS